MKPGLHKIPLPAARWRLFRGLVPALLAAALLEGPARAASPDAAFMALAAREYAWRQVSLAQPIGLPSNRIMSPHLPDVAPAAQVARTRMWDGVLAQLRAMPVAQLSPSARIDYAVYLGQIEALDAAQHFRDYERPANSDSTFWSDLIPTDGKPLRNLAEYRNYLSELAELPRWFDQQIANMRAGAARGFTPPQATLAGRDATIAAIADAASPEATGLWGPLRTMPADIPPAVQDQLRAQARSLIATGAIPAYRRLLAYWRTDYVPHATTQIAAERLPNGVAYYRSKIREFTTLDLDPDRIHAIGLAAVASIHGQMLDQMKAAGFTGTLPEFLRFLRTDPRFYATSPEELLKDAAWVAKRFDGVAATWFGHLPRSRFGIVPVPAALAPFYTAGRGGDGVYLLNTSDLPTRPLYALPALTLHESAPGHAFQIPLAAEARDQPDWRRDSYISAYGEGWALYCEYLGQQMGIYRTPYETFGMLSYQAWRAARLVVDTGIHHQGWSRAQAVAYLHDNTALSDHEVGTEVDRYISWPGQALSYYLGEQAIRDDRTRAEQALGPKFNIRAFHDAILQLGSVPLAELDRRTDRFIADGGRGPYPDEE